MSSPAILLTGATGLLGRFILRRLLDSGYDVATIVRAGTAVGSASALEDPSPENGTPVQQLGRRRIEQVLQPFETNRLLPRPRVIVWDFASTGLLPKFTSSTTRTNNPPQVTSNCLSDEDWNWLTSRPLTVIHCAASIRFQEDSQSGEPYRTNVQGTQNLIELCKQLQLASFHLVSTAYVGDHRSGKPVEETLVGPAHRGGNDYEQSKIQAEQLVTTQLANRPIMIHRPSIVVGDSQTCFTSTFHGFYAPLQVGWQYAKLFGFSEHAGQWFRQQLGLKPDDTKNLVTVDWVAEGIVRAVEATIQKPHKLKSGQPQVVHWTNPRPVACQQMQAAIVDAIERATQLSNSSRHPEQGSLTVPPSPEQFRDQMRVYESYFQSDPVFNSDHSQSIAPHLVCPHVDYTLLSRLSDWAIAGNFGWPKPTLPELEHQSIASLLRNFNWLENQSGCTIIEIQLLGPGSPETLYFALSAELCGRVSQVTQRDQLWRLPLNSLISCLTATTRLSEIIRQGYWLIEGKSGQNTLDCAESWINHIRKFVK